MRLLRWQRRRREELEQGEVKLVEAVASMCDLESKVERLEKDTEILMRRRQREMRERGIAC